MSVDRELEKMVKAHRGFRIDQGRGGAAIVASTGERIRIGNGRKLQPWQIKEFSKWIEDRSRQAARKARVTERRDQGGIPGNVTSQRRTSLKWADEIRRCWPKLLPEERMVIAQEIINELALVDDRFEQARRQIGV